MVYCEYSYSLLQRSLNTLSFLIVLQGAVLAAVASRKFGGKFSSMFKTNNRVCTGFDLSLCISEGCGGHAAD